MIDAVPLIVSKGGANIAFVFAGEDGGQRRYAKSLRRQARMHGIDTLCRIVGPCADMPAALAAADVVVVPALEPPLTGHAAARGAGHGPAGGHHRGRGACRKTCFARRACATTCAPAGWCRPAAPASSRGRLHPRLRSTLRPTEALSARARQFAEFVFSPQSVAEAIRGVYTSLLARDV